MVKHQDERGFFQELYHFNCDDFSIQQLSWFSIEPGQIRGNHFHRKTIERFFILEGDVYFYTRIEGYQHWDIEMLKQGSTKDTQCFVTHAFYSKKGAKVLVLSDRHFNPNDPDTIKGAIDISSIVDTI